jgi:hypothetical protein
MRTVLLISLVAVTTVAAQPGSGVELGPPRQFEAADLQGRAERSGGHLEAAAPAVLL